MTKEKSNCCKAPVKVNNASLGSFYICTKCNRACDPEETKPKIKVTPLIIKDGFADGGKVVVDKETKQSVEDRLIKTIVSNCCKVCACGHHIKIWCAC